MVHEHGYSRYNAGIVWICAKMVYTQITRNTQDPMITMTVAPMVLPKPRAAAIVQSINAEIQYYGAITRIRFIPASITAASVVNSARN